MAPPYDHKLTMAGNREGALAVRAPDTYLPGLGRGPDQRVVQCAPAPQARRAEPQARCPGPQARRQPCAAGTAAFPAQWRAERRGRRAVIEDVVFRLPAARSRALPAAVLSPLEYDHLEPRLAACPAAGEEHRGHVAVHVRRERGEAMPPAQPGGRLGKAVREDPASLGDEVVGHSRDHIPGRTRGDAAELAVSAGGPGRGARPPGSR